jgi:hypothetical protein
MKTISRTRTKKIEAIFGNALSIKRFDLNNGFRGEMTTADGAKHTYEAMPFAKLKEKGTGCYLLQVHSNLWYEIKSAD